MKGENIVCFSKDWNPKDQTCNNHVMRHLARHNKVLWLNSVGTRKPNFSSGRDLKRIFKKLASFFGGVKRIDESFWTYSPIVLPLPQSSVAAAINRQILRTTLKLIRRKLGMDKFQLWTFLPNIGDYVGTLGESSVVYYCADEWSKFNYVDGAKIAAAEKQLCERADVVFATAKSLVDNKRVWNPHTYLASHGVDHALFASALDPHTAVPADIAHLKRPVLGFYGTIQDWIDFDLLIFLAQRHPEWNIVLIGNVMVDVSRLKEYPNIHVLERRDHADLPRYCKAFSVGLIPYVLNERILHVNPIKLREYMCAGLPVVSTNLPECGHYPEHCARAKTFEDFEHAIQRALLNDSPELRQFRSDAMRAESWERKVEEISEHIMHVRRVKEAVARIEKSVAPVRPLPVKQDLSL